MGKLDHLGVGYSLSTAYARKQRNVILDLTSWEGVSQGEADLMRLMQDVDMILHDARERLLHKCHTCNGQGWIWEYAGEEPVKAACPECGP